MPAPARSVTDTTAESGVRWVAFLVVCLAYMATTTGEAVLSPVYPIAAEDLGLDLQQAGAAFALLAFAIAIFNVVGGLLLRRIPTPIVLSIALATSATGATAAALAQTPATFLAAQLLLGAGAGLIYPGAILSVGALAGERRGFAMGIFGVFFSAGLVLAAGLSVLGAQLDWRWAFAFAAGLCAFASLLVLFIRDAPRAERSGPVFAGLAAVLGVPTVVGVVGGISQYATVSFLPVFAVDVWGVRGTTAAGILAAGRVLSVPSKLLSGNLADRIGPIRTARATGVVLASGGITWSLSPSTPIAIVGAVIFAAQVSALFPLANLLAFDRVGRAGPALGAFRSLQLGAGAIAGLSVGSAAHAIGLRPTVAVVSLMPLVLCALPSRTFVGSDAVRSG